MKIVNIKPAKDYKIHIVLDDGREGFFDVSPYLEYEAFKELKNPDSFNKIINGSYYVEWDCGADLSIDTIEAHLN
jgi:hypothetical protein